MSRLCVLLLAAAACAADPIDPAEGPAPSGPGGPTGLLAPPAHGLQVASARRELPPGAEIDDCYYVALGNRDELAVGRLETASFPGQHHFNIYASTIAHEDGFGSCPDLVDTFVLGRPILDGSGAPVDYALPAGVAVRLAPATVLVLNVHALNAGDRAAPQQLALNLHTLTAPAQEYADVYGFSNVDIDIPPASDLTITKQCPVGVPVRLLTMSSHFHWRGTLATAEVVHFGGAPEQVFANGEWAEPYVARFDPAIELAPGDAIRFSCSYSNPDDVEVGYGGSARDDEMCFLFGFYAPAQGLIPCF